MFIVHVFVFICKKGRRTVLVPDNDNNNYSNNIFSFNHSNTVCESCVCEKYLSLFIDKLLYFSLKVDMRQRGKHLILLFKKFSKLVSIKVRPKKVFMTEIECWRSMKIM